LKSSLINIEHACRNAIKLFVDENIPVEINMTAQVRGTSAAHLNKIKNILLVSSGKGGVGKSTVSANLALALAESGAKVGLLDADIYGPSIPLMFGLTNAKPNTIQSESGQNLMEPIERFGIKILSIGFFTDPKQPIPWRGPMVSTAVKQLFNDANWGELDYLVVDLPPGTGDVHITIAQTFPIAGAVIVTTPQQVAISDTIRGMSMFLMEGIEIPLLGLVENMAYFTPAELPDHKYYIFGKSGGKDLAAQFQIPFLGEIPLVKAVSDAGDVGLPIMMEEDNPAEISGKVAQQLSIVQANVRIESE
jgi:ATP-binding protein involved in chromosome partitioning